MRKIWVVLRREFVEKVRTKWFIISTVLGPVLMGAMIFLPVLMAGQGGGERRIAVVDATSTDFGHRLTEMFGGPLPVAAFRVPAELATLGAVADTLTRRVGAKELDGFLLVTDDAVESGRADYRGSNVSSPRDVRILERVFREAVLTERLSRVGVDPHLVAQARIPVELRTMGIRGGRATDQSGEAAFFLAYAMWFIMYIALLLYGVQVAGSVVEEKASRIVEVLVSSLRPFQLLAGKVAGVGAVGLLQLTIWAAAAWLALNQRSTLLALMGMDAAAGQGVSVPQVSAVTIGLFLAYFLLGYFLYAGMFAAVGAMSSTEAEARQAQMPVVMLLVVPTVLMVGILQQPDGDLALTLSLVPFTSPIAMPVRWAAAEVPLIELAASLVFLALGVVFMTWIAARIYRVGILMYGKRPSPRELMRWVTAR